MRPAAASYAASIEPCNPAIGGGGDEVQRFVDLGQTLHAVPDWQTGQVDINREPRHVAIEQIECSSALQREDLLSCDKGVKPYQQRNLGGI
ncbi:hypothetical protein BJF92_15595 [Rhizobium rhizosphaerae]|uniref:Uncharacterized protein n=1 Tax=Xaviernesmea rhizosphaerae TaxID=1672749 RepID=A0A1Q9ALX4_9HYPH|nr:hypothetical protein BJF92_15595 [Xaviernesmea rhizosphaerae]